MDVPALMNSAATCADQAQLTVSSRFRAAADFAASDGSVLTAYSRTLVSTNESGAGIALLPAVRRSDGELPIRLREENGHAAACLLRGVLAQTVE